MRLAVCRRVVHEPGVVLGEVVLHTSIRLAHARKRVPGCGDDRPIELHRGEDLILLKRPRLARHVCNTIVPLPSHAFEAAGGGTHEPWLHTCNTGSFLPHRLDGCPCDELTTSRGEARQQVGLERRVVGDAHAGRDD
eukprot:5038702-Prymnesium_polylepis.1